MTSLVGQGVIRHIENGDLGTVAQIVQSGRVHMDERDQDGQTFLMIASQVGHLGIVQELLRQTLMDVNAVDNDNWSALLNAAKEGHEAIVSALLQAGATVDHKDIGGWTALMWTCYKGHTQCAQILLDQNANPNVKGEHHMSCLTWASGRGHTEVVRSLLAHGAKVNTADKYGTTPLIWASRKGFTVIVDMLLHAGANVDNAGMNSWTALLVASKEGYTEVVGLLLEYSPNVNALDKDGYTALTWAAKDGHVEIVKALLLSGAYVNLPDRYGDTILIHAVKGGHLEVVKALLKKYADVDVQGVDDKTALYWAIEKGHVNVTRALIDVGANVEITNKDGDTALLKAVRSRNYENVRLLMEKHAKVSAADKRGDTALHIAVRGRSKRIMELLLKNPKDARLLYRPNKGGETPYQIDVSKDKSILTQVFGTRNLNATDNIRGYELFSNTIADVLSEPSLNTPINVGLYAKWGSGKSFLTDQLKKDMTTFAEQQAPPEFMFSILQTALSVLISAIIGVILWLTVNWKVGLGVGLGLTLLQFVLLGLLILIVNKKDWNWSYYLSVRLQRKLQLLKLLLLVIFCNQPKSPKRETTRVKFLFTNNARLASVVGEKSITTMISTLSEELEGEFGVIATRIFRVLKPKKALDHGRFKTIFCIPHFVITIVVLMCFAAGCILLGYFGIHKITEPEYTIVDSFLIAFTIIVGLPLLANIVTLCRMVANIVMPAKRRIPKIASRLDSLKSEGFMQSLKKEVELIGQMTNCMDSFLHTHTRLVVIVDGLDSCEQEKLLNVLDTLHMLFGESGSPFVTILAVDPHIIVKGIESNSHVFFQDSSINGHDYLRNMVQLPFFLQGQMVPANRFITQHSNHEGSVGPGESAHRRQDSVMTQRHDSVITTASQVSLNDVGLRNKKKHGPLTSQQLDSPILPPHLLGRQPSQGDLSRSLGKNSYFSDINPRSMKRLMNIIAVTGRLLRAFGVDFSWYKLAAWINITEQWPYRLSWMILEQEDQEHEISDKVTLKAVYDRIQGKLPGSKDVDPLLEIDRNVRKLELFLSNHNPSLTVGDMRRFLPCTINVDPYLRKLIRELQQNIENMTAEYNNMGINTSLISPKGSDVLQTMASMGYVPPNNLRSRHSSGEFQNQRGGPSRVGSRATTATPFGMGQIPWMNPLLMNQYMQQQMQGMGNQSPSLFQQQASNNRGPRVKMIDELNNGKGGLPSERLSGMSIDSVCNMLRRLEGLSSLHLPSYQSRIQENNIAGFVLMTCDLSELKEVLRMNFGDWELFKTLIMMLREKDNAQAKSSASSIDSMENLNSPERFISDIPDGNENPVEIPKPKYHMTRTHSDEAIKLSGQSVQYKPETEPSAEDLQMSQRYRRTKRQDSLMNDVLAESSVIQGMIDMVGIQEVLTEDEEEQEIQEEVSESSSIVKNHVPKQSHDNTSHDQYQEEHQAVDDTTKLVPVSKQQRKKKRSSFKQKRDYETSKKTDADSSIHSNKSTYDTKSIRSAYSAGPDEESDTESEKEMELLKNRQRRMSKGSTHDSTSEPTSPTTNPAFHINMELQSSESVTTQGLSSPGSLDEIRPLMLQQNQQQKSVKEDTLIPMDIATTSSMLAPDAPNILKSNDSSLHLSEQATPVLSPTSSYEYLSLRKLAQMEDSEAPSAFKPISQGTSRHTSPSVSRAGSMKVVRSVSVNSIKEEGGASAGHTNPSMLRLSNEDLPIGHSDNIDV